MMTEFRVGKCKADAVVLNGTGTAYEIKSERDSLTRLTKQVAAYKKVFETVNIIVGENHLDETLASTADDVGVMVLTSAFQISTKRSPSPSTSKICPLAVFDCINLAEAESVLLANGVDIPQVPNTKKHEILRRLFSELTSADAHRGMVETLKRTRNLMSLKNLLDDVPSSLYSATLSSRMRSRDHERYSKSLSTTLTDALSWG